MNDFHQVHEHVQAAISTLGIVCKIHDHSKISPEISSPYDFAAALGYPIQRITKSLLLCSRDRQTYAVAVCSVNHRLDFKSTANAIGANRLEVASAEDLQTKTGYPKNGVSPLGLANNVTVIVDRLLFDHSTVLIGGGATGIELELPPADLLLIPGATMGNITL